MTDAVHHVIATITTAATEVLGDSILQVMVVGAPEVNVVVGPLPAVLGAGAILGVGAILDAGAVLVDAVHRRAKALLGATLQILAALHVTTKPLLGLMSL